MADAAAKSPNEPVSGSDASGIRRILGCVPLRLLVVLGLFALCPVSGRGDEGTPTNLTVYQRLAAAMTDTLGLPLSSVAAGAIGLHVYPAESAWALELDIVQALQRVTGRPRDAAGNAAVAVDAGIVQGVVEYSGTRRDGLFGAKIADRVILLTLRWKAWDPASGTIHFEGELTRTARDTVGVAEIETLETPGLALTRGAMPPEGLFSSVLEPLILIGALAVGVFLLFTVRS